MSSVSDDNCCPDAKITTMIIKFGFSNPYVVGNRLVQCVKTLLKLIYVIRNAQKSCSVNVALTSDTVESMIDRFLKVWFDLLERSFPGCEGPQ